MAHRLKMRDVVCIRVGRTTQASRPGYPEWAGVKQAHPTRRNIVIIRREGQAHPLTCHPRSPRTRRPMLPSINAHATAPASPRNVATWTWSGGGPADHSTAAQSRRAVGRSDSLLDAVELDPQPSPRCSRDLLQRTVVCDRSPTARPPTASSSFARPTPPGSSPARVRASIRIRPTSYSGRVSPAPSTVKSAVGNSPAVRRRIDQRL